VKPPGCVVFSGGVWLPAYSSMTIAFGPEHRTQRHHGLIAFAFVQAIQESALETGLHARLTRDLTVS
jgi:hypothetical protein